MTMNVSRQRLANQQITANEFNDPGQLVAWLGAQQAQDLAGAKWSIALRLPGTNETDINLAIANRSLVRTWPMRGTLHFVPGMDVHWMLALLTPRMIKTMDSRSVHLN